MATKLFEVREKLAKASSEYREIVAKEADLGTDETLPDADVDRLAQLEKDIAVLQSRVARLESAEAMPSVDTSADNSETTDEKAFAPTVKQFQRAEHRTFAQPAEKIEKGLRAGRFVLGMANARKNGARAAADQISKTYGDDLVAKSVLSVSANGSTVIPQYFSEELIDLLRPLVAVRNAGAAVIDTSGGNLTIPRLSAASTASWSTEATDIAYSVQSFNDVTLSNHKLTALVPVSNDLIRRSPIGVDRIVRDDLVFNIARAEDLAFLTGATGGSNPTGLKNQTGIQSFFAAGADITSVIAAIQGAVTALQMQNVKMQRVGWIMTPVVRNFIASLRDSVGNFFVYQQEIMERNTLAGFPIFTTTQLPTNLADYATSGTTGTNGSDIFLCDFADVIIGDTLNVQLDISTDGSYWNGTAYQNAFSQDLTLFRVIKESDLQLRHPVSVVNLKVNSWLLAY